MATGLAVAPRSANGQRLREMVACTLLSYASNTVSVHHNNEVLGVLARIITEPIPKRRSPPS